jgi:hypothetical protein
MKNKTLLASTIEGRVHNAIGRAAGCWQGANIEDIMRNYDEKQANEIAAELCAYIKLNTYPKPKSIWKKWGIYFKSVVHGILVYLPHYLLSAFFIYSAFALILEGFVVTYWQAFGMFWLVRIVAVYITNMTSDKHIKKEELKNQIIKSRT